MPQQIINVGAAGDDGTGDKLRVGGQKINANFAELYAALGSGISAAASATDAANSKAAAAVDAAAAHADRVQADNDAASASANRVLTDTNAAATHADATATAADRVAVAADRLLAETAAAEAAGSNSGAAIYANIADQASITATGWAGTASASAAGAENDRLLADQAKASILAAIAGVTLENATLNAATKDLLAALDTTLGLPAQLTHRLAAGTHEWVVPTAPQVAAFQADVAADAGRMLYVAPAASTGLATDGSQGYWRRSAFAGVLRPEWADGFVGDGVASDQIAFDHLNSLTAHLGYCHVCLTPGTTYMVNRQVQNSGGFYQQGINGIDAVGLSSVVIRGNGATLKSNPGLKFGCFDPATGAVVNYTTAAPAPTSAKADIGYVINADTCGLVDIRDIVIDGNAPSHTIGGTTSTGDTETHHYGLREVSNAQVTVENIKASNFLTDNLVTHDLASMIEGSASRPHTYRACIFDTAGRNSVSFTGGVGYTFDTCLFKGGGSVVVAGGGFLKSAPASAFDLEDESGVIRKAHFVNCGFLQGANGSTAFTSGSGDSEDITFDQCKFVGQSIFGSPRIRAIRCKLFGFIGKLYADPDPSKATLLEDCFITDATEGDTPLQTPSGSPVIISGAIPTGAQLRNSTIDVSRLLPGIVSGMRLKDVTIFIRIGTANLASGGTLMTFGGSGTYENVNVIDAIAANAPAAAYVLAIGTATLLNCNLTSATPNIKWVGPNGFTGLLDTVTGRKGIDTISNSVVLTTTSSKLVQRYDTPLAAPKTVTLPAPVVGISRRYRIHRTVNATGASALNVNTSSAVLLKALSAAAEFVDVESDNGAEYVTVGAGAL